MSITIRSPLPGHQAFDSMSLFCICCDKVMHQARTCKRHTPLVFNVIYIIPILAHICKICSRYIVCLRCAQYMQQLLDRHKRKPTPHNRSWQRAKGIPNRTVWYPFCVWPRSFHVSSVCVVVCPAVEVLVVYGCVWSRRAGHVNCLTIWKHFHTQL
jgi:hypothetical protein